MGDIKQFPATRHWTKAKIEEARDRAAMAENVTLPVGQFLELLDMAGR